MAAKNPSFSSVLNRLNTTLASCSILSSKCSGAEVQLVALWCGVGLGAGVGGEAGAEGRRGFGMACGIDGGMPVLGVRGGLGWECRIDSFRRVVCLTETGVG